MNRMERLAELAVTFGANVQPGQVLRISGEVGHCELTQVMADVAYRRGAGFVDVDLQDPFVHRARVMHAPSDTLGFAPNWPETRIRELDRQHGASIKIVGPTAPGLLDGLDPARVVAAERPRSRAWREAEYRVNCTIVPGPTPAWARAVHPELAPEMALDALWRDIEVVCRLDAPDPAAAWRRRFADLAERARALTALRLDAVRLRGPGTDLVIGLPPSARWDQAGHVSERGIAHAWNLPSEEVFTVPNRDRVDGHARLTRPVRVAGRLVTGATVAFSAGRVIAVSGGDGVATLREFIARDAGMARLGELALVDADSAVAGTGRTYGITLLDENAASHVALGFGFTDLVDDADRDRVNDAPDHLDVMVGTDEVEVTGRHADGHETPLLRAGRWQLGGER